MSSQANSLPAVLISRCLLGEAVRYDGGARALDESVLARLRNRARLVPVCPELAGGLGVPRAPAQIVGGTARDVLAGRARVRTIEGEDVTPFFIAGGQQALRLARAHGCRFALLKEKSPSCGVHLVHDGTFSGHTVAGQGIAAAMLRAAGVRVFSEAETEDLLRMLPVTPGAA